MSSIIQWYMTGPQLIPYEREVSIALVSVGLALIYISSTSGEEASQKKQGRVKKEQLEESSTPQGVVVSKKTKQRASSRGKN